MTDRESMSDLEGSRAHALPVWKVTRELIRFRPGLFVGNMLAMLLAMVALLIPGLVFREFFDLLSDSAQAGSDIWTLMALLVVTEIARSIGLFGLIKTNVPFFVSTMTLLRKNMLRYILKRPGARALPDSPGEAISRFRNDVFEIPLFALWMNDLIGLLALSGGALFLMVSIAPDVTAVALIPFVLVFLVANAATNRIELYRRKSRKWTGIVVGFIGETFGAVQAVKAAGAEEGVVRYLRGLGDTRRKYALKDRLFNEILQSVFQNAVNLGTGVILVLAGQSMRSGDFTVGEFAMFVFYLDFVADLTAFAGLLVARYRQIGVSVERINRLMEGAPEGALVEHGEVHLHGELPTPPTPELSADDRLERFEARGLSYKFDGTDNGIEDVDLSLRPGSFTVVTGRVGSGKTTLLRVLLGLLPRDRGDILYNGERVEQPSEFCVPPRCAYTSQVPRLFSDSLRDNVLMGMDRTDANIADAMHAAVMERDLSELDDGLDTTVGPKGVKLSGGQIQRTAAARMFLRRPQLYVFDDLSSALDVETEKILWSRMGESGEVTALVVSHRRAAFRRADHILVLESGRVTAEGTLEELLESSEEMRRLWHGDDGAADAEVQAKVSA
ncbi:MAG: ABC transporter ATP-binding protein [Myxococcales bacterium]|nr:ABC transporter ATP-binding protein [Myxococcales bacterium]